MKPATKNSIMNIMGGIGVALLIWAFAMLVNPAEAADLARDLQPVDLIEPGDNAWQIPAPVNPIWHDAEAQHLEMGVQLERALDVALDELRKVDQAPGGVPQPKIVIFILRQDGHTVEVNGSPGGITTQLHEWNTVCPTPGWVPGSACN